MRQITFTHVDALTGIPASAAPARNGPRFPAVSGLTFGFALESQYPTNAPTFYGTADDDADLDVPGVLSVITEAEYDAAREAEMAERVRIETERLTTSVDIEADRRIRSGFMFEGKLYQYDDKAQKRITGAATLAGFAKEAGAPEGFLLWHGGTTPFAWIAMDNSLTEMDAQTCFAFGQAAAAWESAHVFAGRALKDAEGGVPADLADDRHWPLLA